MLPRLVGIGAALSGTEVEEIARHQVRSVLHSFPYPRLNDMPSAHSALGSASLRGVAPRPDCFTGAGGNDRPVRNTTASSVEVQELSLLVGPGRGKPGTQARVCLLEQSPAPHIHRLWATALGRNKCRCCLVEIVGGHSDPGIAPHGGLSLQEGAPQPPHPRSTPAPALDP